MDGEFFLPDGRRFDSVFSTKRKGHHNFNIVSKSGVDLGELYASGRSLLVTGFFDSSNQDIGGKLYSEFSVVSSIPHRQKYTVHVRARELSTSVVLFDAPCQIKEGSGDYVLGNAGLPAGVSPWEVRTFGSRVCLYFEVDGERILGSETWGKGHPVRFGGNEGYEFGPYTKTISLSPVIRDKLSGKEYKVPEFVADLTWMGVKPHDPIITG